VAAGRADEGRGAGSWAAAVCGGVGGRKVRWWVGWEKEDMRDGVWMGM